MKKRTNYKKLWKETVQQHDFTVTTGLRVLHDMEERTHVIGETLQYFIKGNAKSINGVDASFSYEPHNPVLAVGGDFFDTIPLVNNKVALIVGDVIGKGPEAASKTVAMKFALRAFAHECDDPCELLEKLNTYIQTYDPDGLVGVAIVVIDAANKTLACASAGAEPPLVVRRDGKVEESQSRGMMLGAASKLECLPWYTEFQDGDLVVLLTDGITECHRPGEDLFIGEIPRILRKLRKKPIQDIANALLLAAKEHAQSMRLHDDACILIAKLQ